MISSTACATLRVRELSHILTTKVIPLSNESRISPIEASEQKAIPASSESIVIGDFKFRIAKVTFDETAMGFVPVDMGAGDQVMFVEFELLEGNKDAFKALKITVADSSGWKSNAFILTSSGMMQMLAAVTMKNASSGYQPGEDSIAWAYLVPRGAYELYLNFPTGEMVDLTPLIKTSRYAGIRLCHECQNLDSRSFSLSGFYMFLMDASFPIYKSVFDISDPKKPMPLAPCKRKIVSIRKSGRILSTHFYFISQRRKQ